MEMFEKKYPDRRVVLENLERNDVRFWFDDGIEVGSEWPEYIAERLASADMMIAFVSNAYALSNNCRKEMHYAVSKGIKIVNIFLEPLVISCHKAKYPPKLKFSSCHYFNFILVRIVCKIK